MIKRLFSIIVITVMLFGTGSLTATQAQDELPPNKPNPETLKQLEEYIQKSFSNTAVPGNNGSQPGPLAPIYSPALSPRLLDKAKPDECFNGIGQPYTGTVGLSCSDSPYSGSQPKVNQSYVWGLTQHGDDLFFGTAANPHCMVFGGLSQSPDPSPMQTDSYVCEFGASQYAPLTGNPLGDWRPPQAFMYDTTASPGSGETPLPAPTPPAATVTFSDTLGLRSAATVGDLIFLAGPALHAPGINIFAYDASSGAFISSTVLTSYTNVRRWVNVSSDLYVGVAKVSGSSTVGTVLRYIGGPNPSDLFNFIEVGTNLGGDAAELAYNPYENRLFVSTWPKSGSPSVASLWMSRDLSTGPLTAADKAPPPFGSWSSVWNIMNYEPDTLTAIMTGGGAMAAADGWLYWGTMHVPFASYIAHLNQYPPNPAWDQETRLTYQLASLLGTHRAISIFRGRNFATAPEIQLVYGEQTLPVFKNGSWQILPNNMGGVAPLFGPSGFGNFYNNYTWSAGVYKDELYFGTMDWSYLLEDGLEPLLPMLGLPPGTTLPLPAANPGADLWRFHDQYSPAEPIDMYGVGNYLNYGIRTMVADADNLYLGSANPMNLMTDPFDGNPDGGWELIQMVSSPELGIEKWATPEVVPVGSVFTYTVRVTNYGFAQANNVTVIDDLPPGVTFNSDSLSACVDSPAGHLTCNLGNLPGNDGYSPAWIDLEIYVTASSSVGYILNRANVYCDGYDPVYENNHTHLFTLVDQTSELGITKTASRAWVGPGQDLDYTITVTNTGTQPFVPLIPLNLDNTGYIYIPGYGMASPYPATQLDLQGVQGQVEAVSVSLTGLSHVRTADLDVMLVSPQGTKVLLMSNAGGGLNFSTMNLSFADGYPPLPQSNPIVSGTYAPTSYSLIPPVFPGAPLGPLEAQLSAFRGENPNGGWQLYVYDHQLGFGGFINAGWSLHLTLKRGLVIDELPEYLTNSYASSAQWLCYDDDPGTFTCHLSSDLGSNDSAGLTFYADVTAYPPPGLPLVFTNTATLQAGGIDPNPTNNMAQAAVTFYPSPDLEVEKSTIYNDAPILPGTTFTYTLDVFNDDGLDFGPASGVFVEDNLPPEVSVVAADPRCDPVSPGDGVVLCGNLGELWPGDALDPPLVITVTAPNTVTWITNRAEVESEQNDADKDNFTYLWSLVDTPTDLEIVKTANLASVQFDQPLTYTLSITNLGPGEFVSQLPFQITNPEEIAIPSIGVADPYPSSMAPVSGLSGKIAHVSVTLTNFYHERTKDLELLLVGPDGTGVILMSEAGTCTSWSTDIPCPTYPVTVTFDDDASAPLPQNAEINNGTYQPTDYGLLHIFPLPAPLGPYSHTLSAFDDLSPNGTWKLYLLDKGLHRDGYIADGWTLNLTLERQVSVHDQLPGAIEFNSLQPGIWDCEVDSGDVLCTTDSPPDTSEITLGVTALYTNSLTIVNTATVETDSYDPDLSNNISEYLLNQWKWWMPVILAFAP